MNCCDFILSDDIRAAVEQHYDEISGQDKCRLIRHGDKSQKQRISAMRQLMDEYPDDPILQEKIRLWPEREQAPTGLFFIGASLRPLFLSKSDDIMGKTEGQELARAAK